MTHSTLRARPTPAPSALPQLLPALGVHGFGAVETAVLTALVTEDPLLLIGKSGTGKTFLLNSLSEALGLEHRHYNASLVSFDDLVGFPYPEQESGTVRFLETPATVWSAESVLIDELSRCKPEHQNRLFSLIHERRVQGLPLPRLRFRWAAMNPPSSDQNGADDYLGSEPLDPALADRFSLFVPAADWADLDSQERTLIANPAGEGCVADDGGVLAGKVAQWRAAFVAGLDACPPLILGYVTAVTSHLNTAGIRISPRRSRLIARSLLAATLIRSGATDALFRNILDCSLPQVTSGGEVSDVAVTAAHRAAWSAANDSADAWLHNFLAEPVLHRKLDILLKANASPDLGSQAVAQLLAGEPQLRRMAFAFAVWPAAALAALPIGPDGINDLGKIAAPILSVDGELRWQQHSGTSGPKKHIEQFARYCAALSGPRRERAQQFFNYCLLEHIPVEDPAAVERDLNAMVEQLRTLVSP